ncbi:hypothetical protein Q7I24_20390, partial [Aeromonas veronii]|uniref:hypothetical protein n=1 Tax=Aeromonas veronii TaxID=654 RepID=UPI003005D755
MVEKLDDWPSAYQQESATRDEAIRKAYRSGGLLYKKSQKQISEHFGIHYSLVSRIISKKASDKSVVYSQSQNERPD